MADIVVVGSANQDINLRVAHLPRPGETVIADGRWKAMGGKGANQAMAAAKLGASVALIARVGKDPAGIAMTSGLQEVGIDIGGIEVDSAEPTGTAMILVDGQGENEIVADPGANGCLDIAQIERHADLFRQGGLCIVQCEIPIQTVVHVVSLCRRNRVRVLFNPSPAIPIDPAVLSGIAYLVPNENELAGLYPVLAGTTRNRDRMADQALRDGVEKVLVTLGGEGCRLVSQEGIRSFPARSVPCVDTTGAGDSFLGAFAAGLAKGMGEASAIRYATVAASITVSRQGTWDAMPDTDDMQSVFDGEPSMWYDL